MLGRNTIDDSKYLDQFSVKVKNFKCFDEKPQGFERIVPFNLIIGRNNSGKSSLLDIFPYLTEGDYTFDSKLHHGNEPPSFIASGALTEEAVNDVFPRGWKGPPFNVYNPSDKKPFLGTRIHWQILGSSKFISIDNCPDGTRPLQGKQNAQSYYNSLLAKMKNPFLQRTFLRIAAERNVEPEVDNDFVSKVGSQEIQEAVQSDGSGTTNVIQNFINKTGLPRDLVEEKLLDHLNNIFAPDLSFANIVCQQEGDRWEIFLREEHKGLIPLSQSGSGLKTVIIVLVHILLMPEVLKKDPGTFIYGCEELENNLHPALLRSLLLYLFNHAKETGALFFLTTHSNVAIDSFSHNKDAQIIHVTHNGQTAECRTVQTYVESKGVLDDLDVRASDLLQSNCIIWVEGPSDRTYINRWIELFTDEKLKEGFHYQCVFYGGRLLSHLSSDPPDEVNEKIALLRLNRNCSLVMDSDREKKRGRLNDTKIRIKSEIESAGGLTWITKGREVENYLHSSSVEKLLGVTARQVGDFEKFPDYLDKIKSGSSKLMKSKAVFSESIVPHIEKSNCFSVLDLEKQISELCKFIRKCNGIKPD